MVSQISLKCRTFCQIYVFLQDMWSLAAGLCDSANSILTHVYPSLRYTNSFEILALYQYIKSTNQHILEGEVGCTKQFEVIESPAVSVEDFLQLSGKWGFRRQRVVYGEDGATHFLSPVPQIDLAKDSTHVRLVQFGMKTS